MIQIIAKIILTMRKKKREFGVRTYDGLADGGQNHHPLTPYAILAHASCIVILGARPTESSPTPTRSNGTHLPREVIAE